MPRRRAAVGPRQCTPCPHLLVCLDEISAMLLPQQRPESTFRPHTGLERLPRRRERRPHERRPPPAAGATSAPAPAHPQIAACQTLKNYPSVGSRAVFPAPGPQAGPCPCGASPQMGACFHGAAALEQAAAAGVIGGRRASPDLQPIPATHLRAAGGAGLPRVIGRGGGWLAPSPPAARCACPAHSAVGLLRCARALSGTCSRRDSPPTTFPSLCPGSTPPTPATMAPKVRCAARGPPLCLPRLWSGSASDRCGLTASGEPVAPTPACQLSRAACQQRGRRGSRALDAPPAAS